MTLADPCPLECGRPFHGLPRLDSHPPCLGPWGKPVPVVEVEPEFMEPCS